jgi:ubiquinone/menaquinone biosynthesis C-methylase UbiE
MTQSPPLAPFTTIPDDLETELKSLLTQPADPTIGAWLLDLIRASGHMSTGDNMRWRLLCMLWLAFEYDLENAWPYLMWLNQNKAVMTEHLTEILTEALDDFGTHLRLARWLAETDAEQLRTFFSEFRNLPLPYKMGDTFAALLKQADSPELAPWLTNFCRHTVDQVSPYIRPWHLFAATWYATCFNQAEGLTYLQHFSADQNKLSPEANQTLTDLAEQLNCSATVIGWIAHCPSPEVKAMLQDFGHPDLTAVTAAIFQAAPDYDLLKNQADQAQADASRFQHNLALLQQAGISPTDPILDLACGPLAGQTIFLHSVGYTVTGADLHLPPMGLPLTGFKQRLKRGQYIRAWQTASNPYQTTLAQATGKSLTLKKLDLKLADLRRLDFATGQFKAVICNHYLADAPDVAGVLAEAARVLKPGGLFIICLPALPGKNGWTEPQFQHTLEQAFVVEKPFGTASEAENTAQTIVAHKQDTANSFKTR